MNKQIYVDRHPQKWEQPRKLFHTLKELEEFLNRFRDLSGGKIWNADLSQLDLTCAKGQELCDKINEYDDQTIWPNCLQDEMANRLKIGQKSGLGISSVHQKGLTGKGVNIAIIDQSLFLEHPEYKDNVCYYKEFGFEEFYQKFGFFPGDGKSSYHGPAVASIAVGKNCGSAPDAELYFLATHDFDLGENKELVFNPTSRLKAIRHLIELNKSLSEKDKIRIVSCSWGDAKTSDFDERKRLFKELEETGCIVLGGCYGCCLQSVGGTKIDENSEATDNLKADFNVPENVLILPQNQRTFALFTGGYSYAQKGGSSWTFPYLAGVMACGLQAYPDYVYQQDWQHKIWQDLLDTALVSSDKHGKIIQPLAFVEKMEQYNKESLLKNVIKDRFEPVTR